MDLISRQDAIDYCYQLINVEHEQGSDEMNYGQERVNQTETILHHLEFMPSAEPKQKTGKWTIEDCHAATYKYCCSECNAHHRARYDFCPTCGARMECEEE